MKKTFLIISFLLTFSLSQGRTSLHVYQGESTLAEKQQTYTTASQVQTSQTLDSIDALHYHLNLRLRANSNPHLSGYACVSIHLHTAVPEIQLELKNATVDSVFVNCQRDTSATYSSPYLTVNTANIHAGDTVDIGVYYHTNGYLENYGFGGIHFNNGIAYNLGIAFSEYPHNMGKAWFPCRDNFSDRATYTLLINTETGWSAQCGGICDSVWNHTDGSINSHWTLPHEIPTYLISVAVAPWHIINRNIVGHYGTYLTTLGYLQHDSTTVQRTFDNLEYVVPMYERCFGPYRWDRIGYVSTPMGSMEHVNNICLHTEAMSNLSENAQSTIVHELSHAWFGNLITCSSAADMWFNEGGASFCEEIAMQAIHANDDPYYHRTYHMTNLEKVIRTCHLDDGGYRPLFDQPHAYTYGTTTYNKGALMWHALRGYLGDSLFYNALRILFDHNAFRSMNGWQVRDSLATYSNTSLNDFFDFHVYGSGFADFVVDSMHYNEGNVTLTLRQRLLGTDQYMQNCRIPITFVGSHEEKCNTIAEMSGCQATLTFNIPFEPLHVIIDPCDTTTRACTSGDLLINHRGTYRHPLSHFNATVTNCGDSTSWLRIEHHWLPPEGDMPYGTVRTANRYWNIIGSLTENTRISGTFFYTCEESTNAEYPHLDKDFYERIESFDSLRLLYRPNNTSEWRLVETSTGGTALNGRLNLSELHTGEYTLAIVDTALTGIVPNKTSDISITVFPNPTTGVITLHADNHRYTVNVHSISGQSVIHNQPFFQQTQLQLPSGIYILHILREDGLNNTQKIVVL